MKKLRIFAASPSDMATERAEIETVVLMLKPTADELNIVVDVTDWRTAVPNMGRTEQVILDQLKPTTWDVFIGILWHRFGTPPGGNHPQTQQEYLGGTEEEFSTAYRLWEQFSKPRIMMYRCARDVPIASLDLDQFKRVKEFFAKFDAVNGEHPGLYQPFDTTEAFKTLLFHNLQTLLLGYGKQRRSKRIPSRIHRVVAPKINDNLRHRAPFFGRDKDMKTALRALSPDDRTWGVLVDGIGGIGKSALAVEAAYRCKEINLFDSFVFVSAQQNILMPEGIRASVPAARTLDEFLNETARVLGQTSITHLEAYSKRRALLDALRLKRTLLIYDNLETLTKDEQETMAVFLRELPQGCKAITTSRRRGGEGAVWLRLEELEWEAVRDIIKGEMTRYPQLASKVRRAGEARWQELYDETKGSPLAILHMLGLMRVRATLTFDGALKLLRGNRNHDLQTFIFQEACRELTKNDQAGLCALSFFVPSAAFEAWMEVAMLSQNALKATIDRLSALSLVDELAGEERYALHPLTRNFVRDKLLADTQIARETGMQFVSYWADYVKRYYREDDKYKDFDSLETERTNIEAAVEWGWLTVKTNDAGVTDEKSMQILNEQLSNLDKFFGHSAELLIEDFYSHSAYGDSEISEPCP